VHIKKIGNDKQKLIKTDKINNATLLMDNTHNRNVPYPQCCHRHVTSRCNWRVTGHL